jgi:hypothetical protein
MTTDNISFYLQNRLIQTNQTGGQQYRDTSPFSIPWPISQYVSALLKTQLFFFFNKCTSLLRIMTNM